MTDRNDSPADGAQLGRAEELVDQMAQTVSVYASQAGFWVLKTLARAREEAEDIWAEAQSASRNEPPE
ncbi:MAG TPA: hypothetical protein VF221_22510 [Chloroflexota bacterium]